MYECAIRCVWPQSRYSRRVEDYQLRARETLRTRPGCEQNAPGRSDFADPYSAWQRGLNENTNGLIRQYVPKGSDVRNLTDLQVQNIMDRLNNRPRKALGFSTPNEVFYNCRKSTG